MRLFSIRFGVHSVGIFMSGEPQLAGRHGLPVPLGTTTQQTHLARMQVIGHGVQNAKEQRNNSCSMS
jgi:hypothetical protein